MDEALVLVFLGNPGREYVATRHNVGWLVADTLDRRLGGLTWNDKFDGSLAATIIKGKKIYFFKPGTFINLSGQPVRKLLDFFKLTQNAILACHDDLELPYGQLAFRRGGGAGGHNGLRSMDSHCGGPDYQRCRIGIGRPKHGTVADFVLSRFSPDEEITLPLLLDKTVESLLDIINGEPPPVGKIQAFQL